MSGEYDRRWGAEVKSFESRFRDLERLASVGEALFGHHFEQRLKEGDGGEATISIHRDEFEDFSWLVCLMGRWTRELDKLLTLAHERACGDRP